MAVPDQFHDRLGAGKNLLRRVDLGEMPVVTVVGADEQDCHFRRRVKLKFPVLQVPEDLFCAIAVMAQIDGAAGCEVSLPNSFERLIFSSELTDRLGDGITNQYQVVGAGLDRGHLFGMTLTWRRSGEIRITRLGRSGCVVNHRRVSVFGSFGCNAAGNSEQQEKDGSVFHGRGIRLQTWRAMSSPAGSWEFEGDGIVLSFE